MVSRVGVDRGEEKRRAREGHGDDERGVVAFWSCLLTRVCTQDKGWVQAVRGNAARDMAGKGL